MQWSARLQQENESTQQTDQGTAGHSGTRTSTREDLVAGRGRSCSRLAIGGRHLGLVVAAVDGRSRSRAGGDGDGGGDAVRIPGGNLSGLGGRRVTMQGQFPEIYAHPDS